MGYPREEIDKVRDATDLVELAAEVTKVKRSGRSVMAVCPFHQEKTPSLSIDGARGLFHCFGCGKSGDVFGWVQETQGTDFRGALELLARRAGITLTEEDPGAAQRRSRREELVGVVEAAAMLYTERLKSGADAGKARSYLRSRDYDVDVIDRFRLGYSPPDWDVLVRTLRSRGVDEKTLVAAGLAIRSRRGRLVDRFRGRVMFPIADLRGDVVGFGARLLEGDGPKYLNSPETPIYHKSKLLYGLDQAKSEIVRSGEAVVVEGYTDVIAFHLAERPIAVATCGTALGADHLDLLRRFTERVVLAFDADAAGAGAAIRGFDVAIPGQLDLRVAELPEGRDPADLIRDGDGGALLAAVSRSEPLLQFRIDRELARFDLSEPEARGRAIRAAAALVATHPDAVARHEYAVLLARRTGVDLQVVLEAIGRPKAPRSEAARPTRKLSGHEKAEQELLRLMLANDARLSSVELSHELFINEQHKHGFEVLEPVVAALQPGEPPDLGSLIAEGANGLADLLSPLALDDRPLPEPAELVIKLKVGVVERRIEQQRRAVEALDPETEPEEYSSKLEELIALEKQRRDIRSGG